jgi:hypothetical protein
MLRFKSTLWARKQLFSFLSVAKSPEKTIST